VRYQNSLAVSSLEFLGELTK